MSKAKKTRTKFTVMQELREVENQLTRPEKAGNIVMPNPVELIQKRTLLRHELKQFDRKSVTGEEGSAIKEHWKRQAEDAQNKIDAQKKKDDELAKKAKQAAKKELKKDKGLRKEIASSLSKKELQELINKKKGKK